MMQAPAVEANHIDEKLLSAKKPNHPIEGPTGWYNDRGEMRGSETPIPGRCGHKLRRTNPPRFCKRRPLRGFAGCKLHFGGNHVGMLNPRFQHGRNSKKQVRPLPVWDA
jgi:hypothetical protein